MESENIILYRPGKLSPEIGHNCGVMPGAEINSELPVTWRLKKGPNASYAEIATLRRGQRGMPSECQPNACVPGAMPGPARCRKAVKIARDSRNAPGAPTPGRPPAPPLPPGPEWNKSEPERPARPALAVDWRSDGDNDDVTRSSDRRNDRPTRA